MRPAVAGRRNFAWHALLACLMIGLPAVRAHAGVVVIGPGMIPVAGYANGNPHAGCEISAALGLNDSEFSVAGHSFTLDWLASSPMPPWPDCAKAATEQAATSNHIASRSTPAETAKWLGVCGAILLILRRSMHR